MESFTITCPHGEEMIIEIDAESRFTRVRTKSGTFLLFKVGEYLLQKRLGSGGVGSVYHAVDHNKREVAIKILENPTQMMLDQFLRECMVQKQLQHENIIKVLGQGSYANIFYMVMEYLPGKDLNGVLREQKYLSPRRAVKIILGVLNALEYAKQFQVIHRDIKPANIYLGDKGEVKLLDLGLAKVWGEDYGLTTTSIIKGTPWYMPYEQYVNTRDVDDRADIYATGATLYHLLCGFPPFREYGLQTVMEAKMYDRYLRLTERKADIPSSLVAIVEKAMKMKPEERYQNATEMKRDLLPVYERLP